jgi:transmembrane serine protease 9
VFATATRVCLAFLPVLLAASPATAQVEADKPGSPYLDAKSYTEPTGRATRAVMQARVVGGLPAPDGAYPWQVSVSIADRPLPDGHFCGGSLIDLRWVVTAAHCMQDVENPKRIRVMYGSNQLSKPGTMVNVASFVVHAGWNRRTWEHDIALMKLEAAASADTVPVMMLDNETRTALFSENVLAFVAGWGLTKDRGLPSETLRHVGVQVVSQETCNAPQAYAGKIKSGMFCAGFVEGGKDSCQGDSGGPIMVSDKKGSYVLAGVVSWGEGCAQPNKYGVYTRISEYIGWIRDNMK